MTFQTLIRAPLIQLLNHVWPVFCFVLCGTTSYFYKNRLMTAKDHYVPPHSTRADRPVHSHQSEWFIINDLNNVRSFIELFSFMLVPLWIVKEGPGLLCLIWSRSMTFRVFVYSESTHSHTHTRTVGLADTAASLFTGVSGYELVLKLNSRSLAMPEGMLLKPVNALCLRINQGVFAW